MFIVDMWNGRWGQEGFRKISCGGDIWDRVLALAKEYGWQPMGAILAKNTKDLSLESSPDYCKCSEDYEVDDYFKGVCSKDAIAMAEAIDKSLVSILMRGIEFPQSACAKILSDDDVKNVEYAKLSGGISFEFLKELMVFLRKGEFYFQWDD